MTARNKASIGFRLSAIGLAVLGATVAGQALAQVTPGFYVGGNVGRAWTDFEHAPFIGVPPAAVTGVFDDDKDTAWKLYGGYQFHPNFGVEGGYFDLGEYDYGYNTAGGTFRGQSRYRGVNIDLVGTFPVWDRVSAIARIGAAYTRATSSVGTTGAVPALGGSRTERDWGPKVGLGLEYAITPALAVRGEWERYRVRDAVRSRGDIDVASIGLVWRFGAPAVVPVAAPAPAPAVIPAPAPAPRVLPPPPPPPVASPPPPAPMPAPAPAARPYRN